MTQPCEHFWVKAGFPEPNIHQCFHCGAYQLIGPPLAHSRDLANWPERAGLQRGAIDGLRFPA